ncbi:MAG: recombinase family protein [Proteobacteria bacterium]|nr:recombinase family protein [Pseudomonadota bacterium]
MSKQYGYIRVSTKEQNDDRQRVALAEIGLKKSQIYIDKQSGMNFNRPQYIKLIQKLVLYIKSIDRMGRNYAEIQQQWRMFAKEKYISICVPDMQLLDTRRDKDLTGTLIADIVLQLLSYVAETERTMIRKRQAVGDCCSESAGKNLGKSKTVI